MTYASLQQNCPINLQFYPTNLGYSTESERVNDKLREVRKNDWQSFTERLLRLRELTKALIEVYGEASEKNWDGYNGEPISRNALTEAQNLITLLPSFLPSPEIVSEPDGSIGFEWYKEKRKRFAISISGNHIINYAGLFGKVDKIYGTEHYIDSLPAVVIKSLQRLFM